MTSTISFQLNGRAVSCQAEPQTALLYALRNDLDQLGLRFGCGLAQCGACTAHLDGQPVRACVLPVQAVAGREVTTLDGLAARWQRGRGAAAPADLHPVQQAFIDEQAAQCGYCINGWIMTAAALVEEQPQRTDAQWREALSGLKCRCGTQVSVLRAVKRAAQQVMALRKQGGGS